VIGDEDGGVGMPDELIRRRAREHADPITGTDGHSGAAAIDGDRHGHLTGA